MYESKKQTKMHWFLLTFAVPAPGYYGLCSMFVSSTTQTMSLPQIVNARNERQIPESATLTDVSYLGRMTNDEMNPPPETIPNLIAPTEAYMDGYHAAVQMQTNNNEPPVNPFVSETPGEGLPQQGIDWAEGFMAGCKRYGNVGKTDV